MRTLWKGAISFGLVNIPVKMYTATEDKDIKFKYLHAKCSSPVRYEKRCPVCNVEIPPEEIVMGYEYEKGKYVIMKEEDFAKIPSEKSRTIDIIDFVSLSEIDPVFFDKTYYLEPNAGGEKAYALLRRAMNDTGKIAIAKVTIRSKGALACLRIKDNAVVMETMFYPDEIRNPQLLTGLNAEPKLTEAEVRMATDLVGNLAAPFEPGKYTDDYRAELMEIISAKIAGAEISIPDQPQQGGKVIDLMEALKASLAATAKAAQDAQETAVRNRRKKAGTESETGGRPPATLTVNAADIAVGEAKAAKGGKGRKKAKTG